jgi:NADH-quinone oxidoreductase subunit E
LNRVYEIIEEIGCDESKLIPILQAVQDEYRYLPEEVMTCVASTLGISPAKVFGVASFYSHFTLVPKGKYVIKLCDGTACHVKKSHDILDAIRDHLRLAEGQSTTPDMMFTLMQVSCLGTCGLAPAVMINEEVHGLLDKDKIVKILEDIEVKEGIKK